MNRVGRPKSRIVGSKRIDSLGYIRVYMPDHPDKMDKDEVYEHRLVVEAHIGRCLLDDEQVHHQNYDRTDNDILNLEIVSEKDHRRLHSGWKKINGQWFKVCKPCGQFLNVEENFYRMPTAWKKHRRFKVNEFSSICKKCYGERSRKYREAA